MSVDLAFVSHDTRNANNVSCESSKNCFSANRISTTEPKLTAEMKGCNPQMENRRIAPSA